MASLRARHSARCALSVGRKVGVETAAPKAERERIPGCTCKPVYSIRGAAGQGYERMGRDLRDALRALAKRRVQEDDGEYVEQQNIGFSAWADQWLDGLEREGTTVASYRSTMKYAKETFKDKLV